MPSREGLSGDLAMDSVTSPERIALLGITTPLTKVAAVSLAWTLVPTAVVPAITFCRIVTGSSMPAAEEGAASDV